MHRSSDRDGLPNDVGLGLHIIVVLLDDVLHFMSVVSMEVTDVVTFAGRTHDVDMAVNTVAMNMNIIVSATAVANSVVRIVLAAIAPAAVRIPTIRTIAISAKPCGIIAISAIVHVPIVCGSITISTTVAILCSTPRGTITISTTGVHVPIMMIFCGPITISTTGAILRRTVPISTAPISTTLVFCGTTTTSTRVHVAVMVVFRGTIATSIGVHVSVLVVSGGIIATSTGVHVAVMVVSGGIIATSTGVHVAVMVVSGGIIATSTGVHVAVMVVCGGTIATSIGVHVPIMVVSCGIITTSTRGHVSIMVVYYGIITTTSTGVHVSMMVQMLTRQRGLIITNHVLNMMNDMVMLAQTSARGSLLG